MKMETMPWTIDFRSGDGTINKKSIESAFKNSYFEKEIILLHSNEETLKYLKFIIQTKFIKLL
jgi:hypothetical protein